MDSIAWPECDELFEFKYRRQALSALARHFLKGGGELRRLKREREIKTERQNEKGQKERQRKRDRERETEKEG